jgi:hypothetical protein
MRSSSPESGRMMVGTEESGARSDTEDWVRCRPGLPFCKGGGEEDRIPVVDVGTGVGYFLYAASCCEGEPSACLFEGRGRAGEEEKGSKAGSSEGAGRLTPAVAGNDGCRLILLGEESIMVRVQLLLRACSHPESLGVWVGAAARLKYAPSEDADSRMSITEL